jgi:hypothetical protein
MHERYFERLRTKLAERGISARYIDRLVAELEDHYADAAAERRGGAHAPMAQGWCRDRLGNEAAIVSQVLARPELRGRFCSFRAATRLLLARSAEVVVRDAIVAESPIMRWSASIASGTMITAALLLLMAQSITLSV